MNAVSLPKEHFSFIDKSNIDFYTKNPCLKDFSNNPSAGNIIMFPKLWKAIRDTLLGQASGLTQVCVGCYIYSL